MFSRRVELLLLVLLLCLSLAHAQLYYDYAGKEESIQLTQLWAEGYWQKIGSINGTITWNKHGDMRGKIVLSPRLAPHEDLIREFQRNGAAAIIFYREGSFHPGFAMYLIDGSNRSDLTIPTMEATFTTDKHFLKLPEGAFIRCLPTENLHKKANETKFQLVMNLIQSFWEMAIIVIAAYRIYQFYFELRSPFMSIAPLCCSLEGIGAILRLAYTCVDPFHTYRILSYNISVIMATISWPFSESAGILLTFFWAETLTKSNIKATPFISDYKWAAVGVIVALFVNEAIMAALRVLFPQSVLPSYITSIVGFIVQVLLIACYLSAAVAIGRRIGKSGKRVVRTMTLRIAVSCIGYFICLGSIIAFALAYQHVWGRGMTLNGVFVGLNLAGTMQVLALRPTPQHKLKSGSTRGSSKTASYGQGLDSGKAHLDSLA